MASIKSYVEESYNELLHKVTWPTWKELQSSTVLVFIASLIIAGLVFLMDYVFGVRTIEADAEGFQWKGLLGYIYDLFIN